MEKVETIGDSGQPLGKIKKEAILSCVVLQHHSSSLFPDLNFSSVLFCLCHVPTPTLPHLPKPMCHFQVAHTEC